MSAVGQISIHPLKAKPIWITLRGTHLPQLKEMPFVKRKLMIKWFVSIRQEREPLSEILKSCTVTRRHAGMQDDEDRCHLLMLLRYCRGKEGTSDFSSP